MKCLYCGKKVIRQDDDAGTWKELYCSLECEEKFDKFVDVIIEKENKKEEQVTHE